MWHTLNYKGRYAGDIRIELTYYDSRPREERPEEIFEAISEGNTPNGTRQNKPVKRRPLPANPTQSSQLTPSRGPRPLPGTSADETFTPSMFRAQEQVNMSTYAPSNPDDSVLEDIPVNGHASGLSHVDYLEERALELASSADAAPGQYSNGYMRHENDQFGQLPYPTTPQDSQPNAVSAYGELDLPELPPHTPRASRSSAALTPKHFTPANSSPSYTLPHYDRSPESIQPHDARELRHSHQSTQPQHSSPLRSHSMDDPYSSQRMEEYVEEPRHYSTGNVREHQGYEAYSVYDQSGPPPPLHTRSANGYRDMPNDLQQPVPVPLPLRQLKNSHSGSLLTHSHIESPEPDYRYSTSPADSRLSAVSAPLSSPYDYDSRNHGHADRYCNDSRRNANHERFPAIEDPSAPAHARSLPTTPRSHGHGVSDAYNRPRDPDVFRRSHHMSNEFGPGHQVQPTYDRQAPRQSPYANQTPPSQHGGQSNRSPHEMARAHRASAPIIKPRAVSPNPRTPIRKSVSPQPEFASQNSGFKGTPFSPDSFDQFNPNLGAARSINAPAPKFDTPESMREVARDMEKAEKLKEGPIVDSAGRVVDPSDHLPADTWAPEPERKTPRKSHQINVRFRHNAQGTQSLPTSAQRRPPPREAVTRPQPTPPREAFPQPQPMPTMQHTFSANDVSPTPAGRNRLQKRNPPGPVHFNSSPAVPLDHGSPSPQALREHPGYGYNHSPSYPRGPPGSGPPPVPAKVPFGAGQEDWNTHSNLQDDFSRIDIGPGRPRRTQQMRY